MNQKLGEMIARMRKDRGMTQDDLAKELNVSYQAVSKWENGISSPDISNLKALAQLFGVSLDALFGLELLPEERISTPVINDGIVAERVTDPTGEKEKGMTASGCEIADEEMACKKEPEEEQLQWAEDDVLRVVMYRGRKLLSFEEVSNKLLSKKILLEYHGEAINVYSCCDVSCGTVSGSVSADGDVSCNAVYGNVSAGGDVSCDAVGSAVSACGDVSCGDVGGDIRCGGDADCGTVGGSVHAGGDVDCGPVGGNVTAAGDIDCGSVGGHVFRA